MQSCKFSQYVLSSKGGWDDIWGWGGGKICGVDGCAAGSGNLMSCLEVDCMVLASKAVECCLLYVCACMRR